MAADPLSLEHDEARFEQLYREYAGDVYRYALAIMRNPADAEDVTQATFLNAWRAFSAGEEPRAPLNWFISIAHNVCRLRFRTKSRRPQEVEFEPALAEAPVNDGPSASDVLEALAELPLNQRAALVMRELEGRSYGEIASILGVSRAAVETLIFRARRSLRIKRDAVRTLAVLPLPQSLSTFFRTRGAAETGLGLLGSGVAAKAVAVLAAGVVAAGVTRDAGRAQAEPDQRPAAPARVVSARAPAARQPVVTVRRAEAPRAQAPARRRPAAQPAPPGPVTHARRGHQAPLDDATAVAGAPRTAPQPTDHAAPVTPPAPPAPAPTPPEAAPPAPPAQPAASPPKVLPEAPPTPELPALPPLPAVPPPPALPAVPPLPPVPEVEVPEVPELPLPPLPPLPALPLGNGP
jgi:RNA polymerase sigma factor (sigma-70 family)